MAKKIETIGVLTSGGDAPGMNAAIRSIVRTALSNGLKVKGILKGYQGLLTKNIIDMDLRSVSGTLQRGGTVLMTARSKEFNSEEGVEKGVQNCHDLGIDGLVVCGGDGSFRGARDLSLKGIPCIGVPCTIDNDIASTDYAIGFDTAINTVVEIIDKLRDTSQSHNRCSVVEVMGNNCGDLALNAAVACGAELALIPEIKHDMERDVLNVMRDAMATGKTHFIIVVAEGVVGGRSKKGKKSMSTMELADYIEEKTGIGTRATIIGHIQRGGTPTMRDRVIASQMGNYAVHLLRKGIGNRVVSRRDNDIVDYDILEALQMRKTFDSKLLQTMREIS
ncbi:6-phosphofructokinase [Bacteroides sp. OttesenSCG-928-J23]|nr:6-phosphofructokinase [Bacteroides sp. OttesenSCG-928-J23]